MFAEKKQDVLDETETKFRIFLSDQCVGGWWDCWELLINCLLKIVFFVAWNVKVQKGIWTLKTRSFLPSTEIWNWFRATGVSHNKQTCNFLAFDYLRLTVLSLTMSPKLNSHFKFGPWKQKSSHPWYSVRRLIGSLWAKIKVKTITKCFNKPTYFLCKGIAISDYSKRLILLSVIDWQTRAVWIKTFDYIIIDLSTKSSSPKADLVAVGNFRLFPLIDIFVRYY